MLGDVFVQPTAFGAEDDRGGPGEFDFVVLVVAALVETVDPIAVFLEIFQSAGDIDHANDGQIGQRPGCRARDDFGQSSRAALWNYDRAGSRGMSGTDDRTEVVRILHAVENHVQAAGGSGFFQRRVFFGRTDPDYALVRHAARGTIEMLARLEADGNFPVAAQVNQFLDPRSAGAFGDQNAVEGAAGPNRLSDGMDSCERRHYDKGTLMSAHENIPVQPAYEIPDKLYFRIGEVARLAGIKPYVLRFWETEFPPLGPRKSGTGHRLYRRKDVELVLEIKRLLYEKRFTIEGARKHLESRGKSDPAARPAKAAKAARAAQGALFQDSSAVLDVVRKELQALAEMLK